MKKILSFLFITTFITLSLCSCSDKSGAVSTAPENYLESSILNDYQGIPGVVTFIGTGDEYLYLYQRTDFESDNYSNWIGEVHKQTITSDSALESTSITFENLIYRDSYVSMDLNNDQLYFLMTEEVDADVENVIYEYNANGKLINKISLDKSINICGTSNLLPFTDDQYYIISDKRMYVTDGSGAIELSLDCPGDYFISIEYLSDADTALIYFDSASSSYYLAILDNTEKKLSNKTKIDIVGNSFAYDDGFIYYISSEGISRINTESFSNEVVVGKKAMTVSLDSVLSIKVTDNGINLVCAGTEKNCFKQLSYIPCDNSVNNISEAESAIGKQPIYLYEYSNDTWKCSELEQIIDAYNEQSDSYNIVLRDYGYANTYDDEFDPLSIITSKDFPDLFFSESNLLTEIFSEKDLFEDLYPYLEESGKVSISDISSPILYDYKKSGKLYSIPRDFSITSITGKRSQMGDPGWTADEFLSWLIDSPNKDIRMNLTRDTALDLCIDSVLDGCIDIENKRADLNSDSFKKFITKLEEANLTTTTKIPNFDSTIDKDAFIVEEAGIERLSRAALADALYDEECVFKGYPSKDGSPKYYYSATSLSILSSSTVKNGAYDFIEFYITYQDDKTLEGASPLYTLKSMTNAGIERTSKYEINMGGDIVFTPSQEQINRVLNTVEYAVPRKISYAEIRMIIEEELPYYFEGQKDLDTVCDIIQSRVSILLSE